MESAIHNKLIDDVNKKIIYITESLDYTVYTTLSEKLSPFTRMFHTQLLVEVEEQLEKQIDFIRK